MIESVEEMLRNSSRFNGHLHRAVIGFEASIDLDQRCIL